MKSLEVSDSSELDYIRLERDAAREHNLVLAEFAAHLENELDQVIAHRDAMIQEVEKLDRLRLFAKRIPGNKILAKAARRWIAAAR